MSSTTKTDAGTAGLTNEHLLMERRHPNSIGGVQRVYRFPCGAGLSAVNSPMLHSYPFAWEIAVLSGVDDEGNFDRLDYSTPLTRDVETFSSDEEANNFIAEASEYFSRTALTSKTGGAS